MVPIRSPWIWVGILIALLAAAAWAGWRLWKKRRPAAAPEAPARLPHEAALEELERLRQAWLLSEGRYEEYYVRLSGIVRRYIENRFGLRAPEMTTEEFLGQAVQAEALRGEHQSRLREFLTHCDLVKFARYRPSPNEASEAFSLAQRFIEETKPILEPAAQ